MAIKFSPVDGFEMSQALWKDDPFTSEKWFKNLFNLFVQIDNASGNGSNIYTDLFLADVEGLVCTSLKIAPFNNKQVQLYNSMFKTNINLAQLAQRAESLSFRLDVVPKSFQVISDTAVMLGLDPQEALYAMKEYGAYLIILQKNLGMDRPINTWMALGDMTGLMREAAKPFSEKYNLQPW